MWGTGKATSLEKHTLLLFQETKLLFKEEEFKSLKETSERVDLVYKHIKKFERFKNIIAESQDKKSNEKSDIYRTEGNNYYVRYQNYLAALECYTKSIAFAEPESSFLALAYGNRSAVLFERKYYKECLEDINRALSLEYPKNLSGKLVNRKSKAETLLPQTKPMKYYDTPPTFKTPNPRISCATDSVEIQYNQKYGRHIVATRNIKVGEVISVENAFCHMIHPESKYIHCHHCLELCYNLIPCENCTNALYCTEECKSKGYEQYHKYECHFPQVLISPEMIFMKLAIMGMEDSKKLEQDPSDGVHKSDSFQEIIKLEMNEEKRSYINLCIPAISASIAYHVFKENSEFVSKYNSDEDDENVKRILYKAYMINAFNPFNIRKIRYSQFNIQSKRVGTALYAFTSLYNHSCVPNCEFFHYGSVIVTRAQAHIKKGEQVTICYGISFSTTDKHTRQAILKKNYLFDCDCKACDLNWRKMEDLPRGKGLPLTFEMKIAKNTFDDSESNKQLMEELLSEGKRLYYILEKCQPCQNLLRLQDMITEIYTYQASKDIEF